MNTIADRLFIELLFVATILLGILFVNNIFLYKQKLRERISLMLIAGFVMCAFEILWTVADGNPQLRTVTFFLVGGYCVAMTVFSALLNRYLIDRFGMKPGKVWTGVVYALPVDALSGTISARVSV